MTRNGKPLPVTVFLDALREGKSTEEAYNLAYPTPALFTDNKGPKE